MQHKLNEDSEKEFYVHRDEKRKGPNPWERVIENCEMNSSQYVGGADVSRMRQALLARKNDVTKAGGMKNINKSTI